MYLYDSRFPETTDDISYTPGGSCQYSLLCTWLSSQPRSIPAFGWYQIIQLGDSSKMAQTCSHTLTENQTH